MTSSSEINNQNRHLPLHGKTALVTGGAKNIGAGTSYELGMRGADVSLLLLCMRRVGYRKTNVS